MAFREFLSSPILFRGDSDSDAENIFIFVDPKSFHIWFRNPGVHFRLIIGFAAFSRAASPSRLCVVLVSFASIS